jgi:hypothetical protein
LFKFRHAMKNKLFSFVTLLTLLGVLAVPLVRSEEAPKEKPVGKRTLAKYDTDKDGKLSDEERAVWDADKAKAKAARKAKKDAEKPAEAAPTQ